MLKKYLVGLFGENLVKEVKVEQRQLPLYLGNSYKFRVYSIYNQKYLFVFPENGLNLKSYKVQRRKIEEFFSLPVVLAVEELNFSQRENLLQNGIEFVEIGRQLFMPRLGLVLDDKEKKLSGKVIEKFSPQIQLCALFFLYKPQREFTANEVSEATGLNTMAISRGVSILVEWGLIAVKRDGRTIYYELNVNKKVYVDSIKDYLISPVYKKVVAERSKMMSGEVMAGYTALECFSSIVDNPIKTFAISKSIYKLIEAECKEDVEYILDNKEYVHVEIWKYDPLIFMKDNCVDKLSLYLSFGNNNDERTEEALEELMEEIING